MIAVLSVAIVFLVVALVHARLELRRTRRLLVQYQVCAWWGEM